MSPLATSLVAVFFYPRINSHSFAFNEQRSFKGKKCKVNTYNLCFFSHSKSQKLNLTTAEGKFEVSYFKRFFENFQKSWNIVNWELDLELRGLSQFFWKEQVEHGFQKKSKEIRISFDILCSVAKQSLTNLL